MAENDSLETKAKDADEKHPKKKGGSKLSQYKWYIVGGLAVIAVLVFYFTKKSAASAAASQTGGSTASGIDPSTGLPYSGGMSMPGFGGIGPAGPPGSSGARGPRGQRGPRGPRGHERHNEHVRPHRHPGGTGGPTPKRTNVGTRQSDMISHASDLRQFTNLNRPAPVRK